MRTNTELTAVEIALRYKQLWMVEQIFRTAKILLDTRPIFHKTDATICGHVFCSFLALVLRDELFRRMDNPGVTAEWDDILRDLNALTETAITYNGKTFAVRSNAVGVADKSHNASGSDCPTPCVRSMLRRRSLTQVPEHRRFKSCRTLLCSAKAFPVPFNSLTSNKFYFSTVEDEISSDAMPTSTTPLTACERLTRSPPVSRPQRRGWSGASSSPVSPADPRLSLNALGAPAAMPRT